MRKKIIVLTVLLLLILPVVLMAQVTIKPPTIVPNSTAFGVLVEQALNTALQSATDLMEIEINNAIEPFKGQDDLVLGFANAGAASTHTGTQRNYNDYKLFALTFGTGFAFSAPSSDIAVIEEAISNIETDGDIYFGAAMQPITATLGINLNPFVENLYGAIKFGYADLSAGTISDDFSFKSLSLGAFLNYQFLKSRQLPLGFLRWRGLSFGSGVLYQRNESVFKVDIPIDPVSTGDLGSYNVALTEQSVDIQVTPELTLGASSNAWTIPLEASTGVRLLWLINLNIGAGVDVAFGSSDVDVNLNSPVEASESTG
ncbi:MAG: hypothetical protein B6241_09695, partial [Spirochaetaceae bacterium 4572_59]